MIGDLEHIKFEMVEEGIALVTLNRPDKLNAYTPRMGVEISRVFQKCDEDDAVRAIVVTGAGRAFCAGADVSAGEKSFGMDSTYEAEGTFKGWHLASRLKKPVIGAINGHAVGIGMTLPLNWDYLIAAEDAKLAFIFVRRGVVPELSSTWILPRTVGVKRALDLLMSGRIFSGADALSYGVVQEALPKEQVLPRAIEYAREIRDNCAPVSVALTKKMVWEHLAYDSPKVVSVRENFIARWTGRSEDSKEGVNAFLEKRKPKWTMGPSKDWPDLSEME